MRSSVLPGHEDRTQIGRTFRTDLDRAAQVPFLLVAEAAILDRGVVTLVSPSNGVVTEDDWAQAAIDGLRQLHARAAVIATDEGERPPDCTCVNSP